MKTSYEYVKKWRAKSKKNAAYKNKHRRARRKELIRLLKEGKMKLSEVPKSYRITESSL